MDILLAYGLWMLLSLSTANATWCHNCEKRSPEDVCPITQEFCWAGPTAGCFTKNRYLGGSTIGTETGCIHECQNFKRGGSFLWFEVYCCFTDYCNA